MIALSVLLQLNVPLTVTHRHGAQPSRAWLPQQTAYSLVLDESTKFFRFGGVLGFHPSGADYVSSILVRTQCNTLLVGL